jgi:hypothetical protein
LARRLLEFDSDIENIIYHYLASQELQKTIILSRGCRELKRLYHKNSRVAASWPVVITCSNSVITRVILPQDCREMAKFYHKTAGLQQVSQHLLLAQIVSLHCHITSGLQGGGKT